MNDNDRNWVGKEIEKSVVPVEKRLEKCEEEIKASVNEIRDTQKDLVEHVVEIKTHLVKQNGHGAMTEKLAADAFEIAKNSAIKSDLAVFSEKTAQDALDIAKKANEKAEGVDARLSGLIVKGLLAVLAAGASGGLASKIVEYFQK